MRQSSNFIRWVITDQGLPFLIFQEKDSKYLILANCNHTRFCNII